MTRNENIKTFEAISKLLEIEKEHTKIYALPNVAFASKECGPRGKRACRGKNPRKGPHSPQSSHSKVGSVKKQKAKGTGSKDMARVKCYNCGKKGHFPRDCPKLVELPLLPKTPKLYVCSHAFVANSVPQWIVDTGATKHIVQDEDGFVEFHR